MIKVTKEGIKDKMQNLSHVNGDLGRMQKSLKQIWRPLADQLCIRKGLFAISFNELMQSIEEGTPLADDQGSCESVEAICFAVLLQFTRGQAMNNKPTPDSLIGL